MKSINTLKTRTTITRNQPHDATAQQHIHTHEYTHAERKLLDFSLLIKKGRRHVAEGHLNPPPKALSLERSVSEPLWKTSVKILRPPKPPTGSNMPHPKHLFRPLYTLFGPSLVPLYTLFTPPTHNTANLDPNLVPSWLSCVLLDAILQLMLPTGCHLMPTCPILAPSRLPRLQFWGKSSKDFNGCHACMFFKCDAI